jgi:hypothetical protein
MLKERLKLIGNDTAEVQLLDEDGDGVVLTLHRDGSSRAVPYLAGLPVANSDVIDILCSRQAQHFATA